MGQGAQSEVRKGIGKEAGREQGESIGIQLSHQADCSVDLGQAICHCVASSGLSSRAQQAGTEEAFIFGSW